MINEKKLIDELKQSGMIADDEYGNYMVDMIENQPKVGVWISCSERLPEPAIGEMFLVCLKNGAVSVAIRPTDGEFMNMVVGLSPERIRYFPEHNPVIAWQPLPESYAENHKD